MSQASVQTLKPGTVLAERYEIVRLIDVGGMGQVYQARQLGLERDVAIKVLDPKGAGRSWEKRFLREVSISQHLTHPNTVRVYDAGKTTEGRPFLVMELLDGETLDRVLEARGRLSLETVTRVGRQALKSLIEAHGKGIVHRDLKPSNLMLCEQPGEEDFIKVVDFGVARVTDSTVRAHFQTEAGVVLGTAQYMSPEQALGDDVDQRSDLFSLGITLFELVTGTLPYASESPINIALRHARGFTIELPEWLADTPLGRVIAGSTRSDRDARFESAQHMLQVLETAVPAPDDVETAPVRRPAGTASVAVERSSVSSDDPSGWMGQTERDQGELSAAPLAAPLLMRRQPAHAGGPPAGPEARPGADGQQRRRALRLVIATALLLGLGVVAELVCGWPI